MPGPRPNKMPRHHEEEGAKAKGSGVWSESGYVQGSLQGDKAMPQGDKATPNTQEGDMWEGDMAAMSSRGRVIDYRLRANTWAGGDEGGYARHRGCHRGHRPTLYGHPEGCMADAWRVPELQKTVLCRFWLSSGCSRGDECTYAHGLDQLRPVPRHFATTRSFRESPLHNSDANAVVRALLGATIG